MPIKEAEDLWPTGPEVLATLEEAVQMAEEIAAPPAERWVARRISDELIPICTTPGLILKWVTCDRLRFVLAF
jgi:hypothetical protein